MDYDLHRALDQAWEKVLKKLKHDPDELMRRKARRRLLTMVQPVRAWCLAVRACDRRITFMDFDARPAHAVAWDEEHNRWRREEHTIELSAKNLRWLCRPVSFMGANWDQVDVARRLGVYPEAVHQAVKRGIFRPHYVRGIGGKRGHPVPLLAVRHLIDPAGFPLGTPADPFWGTMYKWVSEHVPDEACQRLTRRPVYKHCYGRESFNGWRWVCPGCGHQVKVVYWPLGSFIQANFVHPVDDEGSADALPAPLGGFACMKCHNIKHYGRTGPEGWNALVTLMSGGMLYGREVQKPPRWAEGRKVAYKARPGRAPSKRGAQIEAFLIDTDLTCQQIALRLRVSLMTVRMRMRRIFRQHGVHSREELKKKATQSVTLKAAG